MPKMPSVQAVTLSILRGHNDLLDSVSILPGLVGVKVGDWVEDIDYRNFPMLSVRRLGGFRHRTRPKQLAFPVIELTSYVQAPRGDLTECEKLFETALEVLYDAVKYQTQTDSGYLHSIKETMGTTQFSSLYQDSWRTQGLIQLGLKPPRN